VRQQSCRLQVRRERRWLPLPKHTGLRAFPDGGWHAGGQFCRPRSRLLVTSPTSLWGSGCANCAVLAPSSVQFAPNRTQIVHNLHD